MRTIFFPLAAILLLSACKPKEEQKVTLPKANDTIPVKTIALQQGSKIIPITVSGQFTTDDETILSFKTGGIISSVLVREGDYVRKGQLLATLDLTEIKAQVKQAELGLQKAQRDHDRAMKLYKDSVATLEQMQNSLTVLEVAQQQYNAAMFNLANSEIKAPKDGYVLRKFANPGQITGPGTPVLMANGAGSAQWMLRVAVSDKDWAKVQVNDPAVIQMDALPGKSFDAYVSHKMESADMYSGAFIVELKLKSVPKGLAAGLFGKATISPRQSLNTWSVPYAALLDGHAQQGYVFITQDGKTAQRVPVTIAAIRKDEIEISSGLENAQQLIIAGSAYLKDGSLIKIIP